MFCISVPNSNNCDCIFRKTSTIQKLVELDGALELMTDILININVTNKKNSVSIQRSNGFEVAQSA